MIHTILCLMPRNRSLERPGQCRRRSCALRKSKTSTVVLVAVLTLLLNWPDALNMTFERIVAQERKETKIHARFPYILAEEFVGSAWAWFHQGWIDFMQQRSGHSSLVYPWLRYYRTAQRSAEADIPPLLSQREAARLLHVGERSLRRSLDKAELRATARPAQGIAAGVAAH